MFIEPIPPSPYPRVRVIAVLQTNQLEMILHLETNATGEWCEQSNNNLITWNEHLHLASTFR